ncbi:CREB-binding protein [Myotis davidii]|uniref:histone acetyltransferase n=1 Tax=Myotis davidii TaxID=225400 RepID=L5MFH1_MYODS|nr:CREB-binding protein [Myotis davidii]
MPRSSSSSSSRKAALAWLQAWQDTPSSSSLRDLTSRFQEFVRVAEGANEELHEVKESGLAMLVELHNQGQDRCVLTCTECKQRVETGWHCPGCQDYDLCINCYNTKGHTHEMVKLGLSPDEEAEEGHEGGIQREMQFRRIREARRLSILRCIQTLRHAHHCHDASCSRTNCQKMKRVLLHPMHCQRQANGGCPVCKQLITVCYYHAKSCQRNPCPVPFCLSIKQTLRERRLRLRQQRIGNRLPQG